MKRFNVLAVWLSAVVTHWPRST